MWIMLCLMGTPLRSFVSLTTSSSSSSSSCTCFLSDWLRLSSFSLRCGHIFIQVLLVCSLLNWMTFVCGAPKARANEGHSIGNRYMTTSMADHNFLSNCLCRLVGVQSKPDDDHRRRLQASEMEADKPKMHIRYPDVFVGTHKVVISDVLPKLPPEDINRTVTHLAMITDILFAPNGLQVYYTLTERLIEQSGSRRDYTMSRLSYRKADLSSVRQGMTANVQSELISYWWPKVSPNGPRVTSPDICDRTRKYCNHTFMEGIELPASGDRLVISSRTYPPNLVYLSIADGSRSSQPMATEVLQTLALNPAKTTLYVASEQRILSIAVDDTGMPVNGNQVSTMATYVPPPVVGGLDPLQLSAQGFVSNGRCLYILENTHRQLLVTEPTSSAPNFTTVLQGLNPDNTVFMQTMVATPDGCNVFITDVGRDGREGYLRWVKVRAPCESGGTLETLIHYSGRSFWGLALLEYEGVLYLYIGTSDGRILELQLNKSKLHACVPSSPNATSAAALSAVSGVESATLTAPLTPDKSDWPERVPASDAIPVPPCYGHSQLVPPERLILMASLFAGAVLVLLVLMGLLFSFPSRQSFREVEGESEQGGGGGGGVDAELLKPSNVHIAPDSPDRRG